MLTAAFQNIESVLNWEQGLSQILEHLDPSSKAFPPGMSLTLAHGTIACSSKVVFLGHDGYQGPYWSPQAPLLSPPAPQCASSELSWMLPFRLRFLSSRLRSSRAEVVPLIPSREHVHAPVCISSLRPLTTLPNDIAPISPPLLLPFLLLLLLLLLPLTGS